jgi:CRISPR-associated protein Cas2
MMFVILSYDVAEKRNAKVSRTVKKYLAFRQKSLYQGYLTEKQLARLQSELLLRIDPEQDSVVVYKLDTDNALSVDEIGPVRTRGSFIF